MNNWQSVKLGSFVRYATDKITSDGFGLHNYISTENMLQDKAGICEAAGMPSTGFATHYSVGDTLISNIRPYFKKIWFADRDGGASNDVLVFKTDELDKKYLYYLLSQDEFFNYVMAGSKGTKMPRGDKEQIKQFAFELPSLPEQKAIAEMLSALDDKIEANRKESETLEAIAAALFKSWFVDFEPFDGKMSDDWKEGCLGDYCSIKSGFAFKSSWWQQHGVRVIKIKNITEKGFDLSDCSFVSDDKIPYARDFVALAGDLLIAMTGATIGKFAIIPQCEETLLVNQRVGKFFLGAEPLKKLPFLWCTLRQDDVFNEIINRGQGSAQPNISPTDIMTIPMIIPSDKVLCNFNEALCSFFEKITFNAAQNKKLAQIRDTLLPRLMSGKIRIPPFGGNK